MKIISKFKDYYDSETYNLGEDVFYDRNMNLRYIENNIIKEGTEVKNCIEIFKKYLPRYYTPFKRYKTKDIKQELYFNIVFIGDKIVPYCTLYFGDYYNYIIGKNIEYINIFNNDIDNTLHTDIIRRSKNHLNTNYFTLFNKIREITKEPIVSFSSYNNYSNISNLIKMNNGVMLNPSLKELGFSKIIKPSEIIQELELFIKKYNNVEKDIKFSNELKILNAGFDSKSFRN